VIEDPFYPGLPPALVLAKRESMLLSVVCQKKPSQMLLMCQLLRLVYPYAPGGTISSLHLQLLLLMSPSVYQSAKHDGDAAYILLPFLSSSCSSNGSYASMTTCAESEENLEAEPFPDFQQWQPGRSALPLNHDETS